MMLANIPLLWAQITGSGRIEMTVHPDTSASFPWSTSKKERRWWGPAPLPHPQIPHLLSPPSSLALRLGIWVLKACDMRTDVRTWPLSRFLATYCWWHHDTQDNLWLGEELLKKYFNFFLHTKSILVASSNCGWTSDATCTVLSMSLLRFWAWEHFKPTTHENISLWEREREKHKSLISSIYYFIQK